MASTRTTANMPINYQEQLAAEAKAIASRIGAASGDRIRFNGNQGFVTPDGSDGSTMEVVVVDFMSANMFYDSAFDANNPQPPACFAIGPEPLMLVPSANSPDKQADVCSSCPMNAFGSAGRGKACKNTRLLAVIPVSALEDGDADTAPIWVMSVPPSSVRTFDSYVKTLSVRHNTVPIGVVTRVTMDKGVSFAAPQFAVARPLELDSEVGEVMARRAESRTRLMTEPDVSQYTPPSARTRRR